jgi:hypothetical protein
MMAVLLELEAVADTFPLSQHQAVAMVVRQAVTELINKEK